MPTKLLVRLGRMKPAGPKPAKKQGKKTASSPSTKIKAPSGRPRPRPRKSAVDVDIPTVQASSDQQQPGRASPSLTPAPCFSGLAAEVDGEVEARAELEKREVQKQEVSARCERKEKEIDNILEELLEVQGEPVEEGSARCYSDDPESWPTSPLDAPPDYLSCRLDQAEMPLDKIATSSSTSTGSSFHGSIDIETGSEGGSGDKYDQALRCWFPVEYAYGLPGLPGRSYPWALGHV